MRGCDIDREQEVWEYRPSSHKTQYHGHQRVVPLGPKAQLVLAPFLIEDPEAYLFCPQRRMLAVNEHRRTKRQTPMTPSQAARRPKVAPRKQPGNRYTTSSYAHAIAQACRRAGLETWGPNRLRHSAATRFRKSSGLDAARVILGHRSVEVTVIYAEADRQKAVEVVREVG